MSKFLVTGGGGFIGSHITEALLKRGHAVRVFDDFSTGRRENLAGLQGDLEVVEGDLRKFDQVAAAVKGVAGIFHQGARPSVIRSMKEPQISDAVNVNGTINVIKAASDEGVRRIVFAS